MATSKYSLQVWQYMNAHLRNIIIAIYTLCHICQMDVSYCRTIFLVRMSYIVEFVVSSRSRSQGYAYWRGVSDPEKMIANSHTLFVTWFYSFFANVGKSIQFRAESIRQESGDIATDDRKVEVFIVRSRRKTVKIRSGSTYAWTKWRSAIACYSPSRSSRGLEKSNSQNTSDEFSTKICWT